MSEPTNGEIVIMLDNLGSKFDSFAELNTADHTELKAHAKETNGRVTKLEKYRDMLIGGMVLINIVVVPTFLFVLFRFIESK